MEKTDKSAEDIYDKHIAGPPFNTGVTEAVVNAMHEYADQEVAKYKAVIEKLLPLAEKTIYNRNEYLELLDEAKQLIK